MADQDKPAREPINVVVSYTVKPGKEEEFERTLHQAIEMSRHYAGHQGATVIKDQDRRYHLVYRFSDHDKLDRWLRSGERKRVLDKISHLIEDDEIRPQKITGFEAWFTAPGGDHVSSPPRWKMLIATFLGAYPVVVLFQWLIAPHIIKWPLLLRSLAFPVIILSVMTYIVMPRVTRLLRGWLYKD